MNKVKKIELILPEINDKIENTRQILWALHSECRIVANRTVQYLWEWNGLSSDYKKEYDHFPDKEETAKLLSGKNGIDTYAYAKIVPECQCLSTRSISTIIRDVKGKYMKVLGDILKGNRSIPSFRSNYPIPVEKQSYALSHVVKYDNNGHPCDEDYYIDVGILSRAGAERFDTGTRLRFKLRVGLQLTRMCVMKDRSISEAHNLQVATHAYVCGERERLTTLMELFLKLAVCNCIFKFALVVNAIINVKPLNIILDSIFAVE